MSREFVTRFNELPERLRYVRGLRAWLGGRQIPVAVKRDARRAGRPQYTFAQLASEPGYRRARVIFIRPPQGNFIARYRHVGSRPRRVHRCTRLEIPWSPPERCWARHDCPFCPLHRWRSTADSWNPGRIRRPDLYRVKPRPVEGVGGV